MPRYMVITTVKPAAVPADNDTTFPNVYRLVGDTGWESVNGYCKYLSKYPLSPGKGIKQGAPLMPVAGLEYQTEHIAADSTTAGNAASTWITSRFAGWSVPSTWTVTARTVYTMLSTTIGAPTIDTSVLPVNL